MTRLRHYIIAIILTLAGFAIVGAQQRHTLIDNNKSIQGTSATNETTENDGSIAQEAKRTIERVEDVEIKSPAGTSPRLPYQLLVTYSDSTQAYRQVRWSNAALATEQELSNYPAGKSYIVEGFITGDESTPNGFPVRANVIVSTDPYIVPSAPICEPLPLDNVCITGDNRLTSNRDLAIR